MRITKLSLTNFRSFKETQTIEFAPVTLLFGANSVGKSTVLMALFYVQQILAKGQCDPQRLEALGNKFIGGFKNLVHGKNIDETIKIKIEYDKSDSIGSTYWNLIDYIGAENNLLMDEGITDVKTIATEFSIAWSKTNNTAYVSNYSVWFDDSLIASVTSDSGMKQPMISHLNYLHDTLIEDNYWNWLQEKVDNEGIVHPYCLEHILDLKKAYIPGTQEYLEDEVNNLKESGILNKYEAAGFFHQLLNSNVLGNDITSSPMISVLNSATDNKLYDLLHNPIGIKGTSGALPIIGSLLSTSLSLDSDQENVIVNEILSDVVVAPLDNLLSLLNDSLCIGPLRHIPDAQYQHNPYPTQADWYTGKAAWDEMATADFPLTRKIDAWLSDKDKLNLGYRLLLKAETTTKKLLLPNWDMNSDTALKDLAVFMKHIETEVSDLKISISSESEPECVEYVPAQVEDNNQVARSEIIEPEETSLPTTVNDPKVEKLLNEFSSMIQAQKPSIDKGTQTQESKSTSLSLWDINSEIEVDVSDIGVGVSQLMPLIIAALIKGKGIIACEQPELHVHPKVQVSIGDLLTQSNKYCTFLIETHSEHLVLRLLRRIRETTNGTLSENLKPVRPEDISITCIENSSAGVITRRLNITEDGDFSEEWPGGFFDERDEELF